MDGKTAKLLLDNLLARIVIDPDTGQKSLPGILTPLEIEALEMAADVFADTEIIDDAVASPVAEKGQEEDVSGKTNSEDDSTLPPKSDVQEEVESEHADDEEEQESDGEEAAVQESGKPEEVPPPPSEPSPITLNLASLEYETLQNPNIKMCLDFGTAMSKAFASEIEDGDIVEGLKLKLGYRASGGTSKDIYPVPSSLWISEEGKVYFGEQAIVKSLQADPSRTRERFDSLKRELILGMKEETPYSMMMNKNLNPTDCPLSKGDAIILYLGYLTDLACSEMESEYGSSRYVTRNFGLPSWDSERRAWGDKLLRTMLVKAQIVADTFHDQWDNGVSIHAIKSVLEQIEALDRLPEYLVGQGITEPLAVGSARLHKDEPYRGLVMVVDVGAGTSDLALFVVAGDPDRNLFNAFPVKGCNKSLHMAGDTLDSALQQAILKKAGVKSQDHDYPYIIQHLRMQLRALKEELFQNGSCIVTLINGNRERMEIEEFLHHAPVKRFSQQLEKKFTDVVQAMKRGVVEHFGEGGLSVVLTGGGATLPMVKELVSGGFSMHGTHIKKDEVPLVPEDFEHDIELARVYPQLAVAIGGTMPHIIDEKNSIDDFDIPKGKFTLNRVQVTGI